MSEQGDYSSFLESIGTIGDAQKAIRKALSDIHKRRREVDGSEITPLDFDDARTRLMLVLQNLPVDVASVSVATKFPRVAGKPTANVEYETKTLQFLLEQLDPTFKNVQDIDYTFTVRPNFIPEELKELSHGSRVRELASRVIETLEVDYSSKTHVLLIKPYGAPEGMAGIWALDAKPYRIPLRYVADIALNTDQKPLTPYFEGRNWEALKRIPVVYDSAKQLPT